MALLFISNIVPDVNKYQNEALNRSGNNVLIGIANALPTTENATIISMRPTPSFPKAQIWFGGEKALLESGKEIHIIPTLNIKIVKNVFWGIYMFFYVFIWAQKNIRQAKNVLVYNIYTPPISYLYSACKLSKSKLTAILYDLGVPPQRLGLSKLTMMGYKAMEKSAKKYIPKLDGRIVINESIVDYYALGKDFILVDGGVNEQVLNKLFKLNETSTDYYTLALAGMLWDQNGTKLILETLEKYPDLKVKVLFAGKGIDVDLIKEQAAKDERIMYMGMLSLQEVFKLYEQADILLNLRLAEEVDFHFPSKLLEYMVTGKHVLSTPVAHAERDYGKYVSILKDMTPDGLYMKLNEIMSLGKNELYLRGTEARNFMLENRTWEKRTKEILVYINAL